jgi:Glycosyltransferase family 87
MEVTQAPLVEIPAVSPKSIWRDARTFWCLAFIPYFIAIAFSFRSIALGHRPGNLCDFLGAAADMRAGKDIYNGGTGGYVYPPLIAFLYQPLAALPERDAAYVSLAINALLAVFTLILISKVLVERLVGRIDPLLTAQVAFFGALCTADKIKGEFYHLETNVFMLLAFAAAMRWVDRRPWLCGLALGFGFNIKFLPLILVPFLIVRKRWHAIAWFAIWAIVFALLPALSMGFDSNLQAWREESGGMFRLFGIGNGITHAAHVRLITDPVSISLTSGLARISGWSSPWPIVLAAGIGLIFGLFAWVVYRLNKTPVIVWPDRNEQALLPLRGILTVEWIGMLTLILIFSPFTNSRHLYMLLEINVAAGVLLLGTQGRVARAPLAVAAVLMALGVTFPPGGIKFFARADDFWRQTGGGAWCMLLMYTALIWTNMRYQKAPATKEIEYDVDSGVMNHALIVRRPTGPSVPARSFDSA